MQSNNKIQISNLEIIFIDDDGFAVGHILNINRPNQEIESPFDNKNIDLKMLKEVGIKGVLIGEKFMREKNIEDGFKTLLKPV